MKKKKRKVVGVGELVWSLEPKKKETHQHQGAQGCLLSSRVVNFLRHRATLQERPYDQSGSDSLAGGALQI